MRRRNDGRSCDKAKIVNRACPAERRGSRSNYDVVGFTENDAAAPY